MRHQLELHSFFYNNPRIAVAYSGGVDSSYLLYVAKTAGCDVRAYFVKSQFQPKFELDDAVRLSDLLGVSLTVVTIDALQDPNIALNPPERCYYCKSAILSKLWELARADGIDVLCDGTNADDDEAGRPGMRALRELGVVSPLRDSGLTKADIRQLSKQAGLFTHDKPSYACLATRIPTGTEITQEILDKIECAESMLFDMGFSGFRVRVIVKSGQTQEKQDDESQTMQKKEHGDSSFASPEQERDSPAMKIIANIQMPKDQWNIAKARHAEILATLEPSFDSVALDLRSG